jgi:hypothetical protein
MIAQQAQRREQVRIAVHVIEAIMREWDEDIHFKVQSTEWLARVLDSYTPSVDYSQAEAELIPLGRTLHSLVTRRRTKGDAVGVHVLNALLDRVSKALKVMQGE